MVHLWTKISKRRGIRALLAAPRPARTFGVKTSLLGETGARTHPAEVIVWLAAQSPGELRGQEGDTAALGEFGALVLWRVAWRNRELGRRSALRRESVERRVSSAAAAADESGLFVRAAIRGPGGAPRREEAGRDRGRGGGGALLAARAVRGTRVRSTGSTAGARLVEMTARARAALIGAATREEQGGPATTHVRSAECCRGAMRDINHARSTSCCLMGRLLLSPHLNLLLNCVQEQVALAPAPLRASSQSPVPDFPPPTRHKGGGCGKSGTVSWDVRAGRGARAQERLRTLRTDRVGRKNGQGNRRRDEQPELGQRGGGR